VTEADDALELRGAVASEQERAAATQIAALFAPHKQIRNSLDVDPTLPSEEAESTDNADLWSPEEIGEIERIDWASEAMDQAGPVHPHPDG
jgi:hypothetical protein